MCAYILVCNSWREKRREKESSKPCVLYMCELKNKGVIVKRYVFKRKGQIDRGVFSYKQNGKHLRQF